MVLTDIEKIVSHVAGTDNEKIEKKAIETVQIVVFNLDNEEYAFKISDIQEIIEIPEITPIPSSPEFVSGILNLRGKIIVVIDLEKRFSLVRENNQEVQKHIIVTTIDGNSYGIIVDRVKEVLRIDTDTIQTTPDLITSKIKEDYFEGVVVFDTKDDTDVKTEARLVIILNLKSLLEEKELSLLKETIDKSTKTVVA